MALKDIFKKEVKKLEVKKFSRSWQVLRSPHVTEKASALAAKNDYVFRVFSRTNKKEVSRAVESIFGVDVLDVKIINVPERKRRLGKIKGNRPGYKKAVVRIKEGQKIEIMPR